MLREYRDELYTELCDLSKKVTYWRSVALGLFVGFILVNAFWMYVCLRYIEDHQ